MLDQPVHHPRGACIEHEATDDGAILTRHMEIPVGDRSVNVVIELPLRPQIDATALLPRCGTVKQRNH
jgi:hypothetical protein